MYAQQILGNFIGFACVAPLVMLASDKDRGELRTTLGICLFYYLCYHTALLAPVHGWLGLPLLSWNWGGKVLGIAFTILCYVTWRHRVALPERSSDSPPARRFVFGMVLAIAVLALVEGLVFYHQGWDLETLAFQATLPGIDEELAYRGMLLGLLTPAMRPEVRVGKLVIRHPAIWLVSLLFGLDHGLDLDLQWQLQFDPLHFSKTFVLGTLWGYLAVATRGVGWPILSHNLANVLPNLVGMLK